MKHPCFLQILDFVSSVRFCTDQWQSGGKRWVLSLLTEEATTTMESRGDGSGGGAASSL